MICAQSVTAVALALLGATAHAQTAVIEGRLLDSSGKPIVGYPVILENQVSIEQGYSGNVGFTSDTGQFLITIDQPGTYTAQIPNAPDAAVEFTTPETMVSKTWPSFIPLGLGKEAEAGLPSMDIGTIQVTGSQ